MNQKVSYFQIKISAIGKSDETTKTKAIQNGIGQYLNCPNCLVVNINFFLPKMESKIDSIF